MSINLNKIYDSFNEIKDNKKNLSEDESKLPVELRETEERPKEVECQK